MPNEDLHKPLEAINKSIARLREDVQKLTAEVTKIHSVIQEGVASIRDAIQENIQAQAELKLMEHAMEVRSVKPQIEAEHDQIRTEREELDERLASIGERYEDKHAELDEKARQRIRNLGEHIFEVDEEQFEAGIEEPFTEQVTTAWRVLQSHNADVREGRRDRITEATGEAVQTMYEYMDRQEALIENIQRYRIGERETGLPTDRVEPLQVPYYAVQYEVDGVSQRQILVPARLSTTDADWCRVSLPAMEGTKSLLRGVSGVDDPADTEYLREEDVQRALERYSEESLLGLSYSDAVAEAMPEDGSVPVAIEGGDT